MSKNEEIVKIPRSHKFKPRDGDFNKKVKQLFSERAVELIRSAIDEALGGDKRLLAIFVNKLIPDMSRESFVDFVKLNGTPVEKSEQIMDQATSGQITPTDGIALMSLLEKQIQINELREVHRKQVQIFEIYESMKNKSKG